MRKVLVPGSSLGGARPKASVRDLDGRLSIAKFPRKDDDTHVVSWEAITLSLAEKAGVRVLSWRLDDVHGKPVLIIKRFDRDGTKRVPFLSAMSMIGTRDNEQRSYLELAYALAQNGSAPKADMEELWRRIVFSILVSNTDEIICAITALSMSATKGGAYPLFMTLTQHLSIFGRAFFQRPLISTMERLP